MKKLTIGRDGFGIPIELATGSIAMLANKGAGKTYAAAVLTEELIGAGVPTCTIDFVGVCWGLKSSASGKSAGLPVTIFGGDHADLPLEEGSAEIIARWFVDRRFNAIIDISHLRKAARTRFLTPFFLELYRLNREPIHLVCDEADSYIPQKVYSEAAACVGAMEDIVRRGRARGIGSTLITQRPASINKDVLTQCETLFALRIGHPKDLEPVMDWVRVQADPAKADEMLKSLPSLETGTAWIWSPRADIFERIAIRERETFDSSKTPEIGRKRIEPTAFAKIDLEALGEEIKATVQRAKENDPASLKAELAKAKTRIFVLEKEQESLARLKESKPEIREVSILDVGAAELMRFTGQQLKLVHEDFQRIEKAIEAKAKVVDRKSAPVPIAAVRDAVMKAFGDAAEKKMLARPEGQKLGACERAILAAGATRHPKSSSRSQLAVISGYSLTSSSFANALSALRIAGLIEGFGDQIQLTAQGVFLAPDPGPQDGESIRRLWLGKLGKCERAILELLIGDYPHAIGRGYIAERTGYSESSSSFANALSKLRTLELITRGSEIKATETLFA